MIKSIDSSPNSTMHVVLWYAPSPPPRPLLTNALLKAGTHYGDFHEAGAKRRVSSACYVRARDVMQCLLAHIFVGRG